MRSRLPTSTGIEVVRRLLTPTLARPRRLREPMSLTGDLLRSTGWKGADVVAFSCLWLKPPPGARSARNTGTGEGDAGCAPPRPIFLDLVAANAGGGGGGKLRFLGSPIGRCIVVN